MKEYRFVKRDANWFIDLPDYIEAGGNINDLQMVEGADTMLDIIGAGLPEVFMAIDQVPFEGADKLILTEKCDANIGGGYYLLYEYNGEKIEREMWLCNVTEYVFGNLPEAIYIKKLK